MQQRTLGTDAPVSAIGLMTAGYSGRRDTARRVDLVRGTVDRYLTFADTTDIHGRHADHEPVGEIRPFNRVRS